MLKIHYNRLLCAQTAVYLHCQNKTIGIKLNRYKSLKRQVKRLFKDSRKIV